MNTHTMLNPDTVADVDAQIARLIQANEELKAELEKQYVLTLNLERDHAVACSQRDAWRESNKLLGLRLTMLHAGLIDGQAELKRRLDLIEPALDRIANHRQKLVTQEQLDATMAEWSATTVRLCKRELSEAEIGGAGVVGRGEDSTQAIYSHCASAPASSPEQHTEK